jgi:KDO2-lipid IV(A) lauroyltransferase
VIVGEVIRPPHTGDEEADVKTMTAAYLRFLEANIRHYPDQWLWTHNRWKLRPSGGNSDDKPA